MCRRQTGAFTAPTVGRIADVSRRNLPPVEPAAGRGPSASLRSLCTRLRFHLFSKTAARQTRVHQHRLKKRGQKIIANQEINTSC